MKWQEKSSLELGSQRVRQGFLFLPKKIKGETRFWEQAFWLEVLRGGTVSYPHTHWVAIEWLSLPEWYDPKTGKPKPEPKKESKTSADVPQCCENCVHVRRHGSALPNCIYCSTFRPEFSFYRSIDPDALFWKRNLRHSSPELEGLSGGITRYVQSQLFEAFKKAGIPTKFERR